MSSKEEYLDSLLQMVNTSEQTGTAADLQTDQKTKAKKVKNNESSSETELEPEELDFPELAALFAEDEPEEEETEDETTQIEEASDLAEDFTAGSQDAKAAENLTSESQDAKETEDFTMGSQNAKETEDFTMGSQNAEAAEDVKSESEKTKAAEDFAAESGNINETETFSAGDVSFESGIGNTEVIMPPLRDAEDMDIAELEAMLSGTAQYQPEEPAAVNAGNIAANDTIIDAELAGMDQDKIDSSGIDIGKGSAPEAKMQEADAVKQQDMDTVDVTELIDAMDDDGDLAEISQLLKSADNQEMIPDDMLDVAAMLDGSSGAGDLNEVQKNAEGASIDEMGDELEAETETKKSRKKKEKKEKKKKDPSEKKIGIFGRIFKFLMEDDEINDLEEELGQLDLSQENIAILESLDAESGNGGKKSQKKKKPKKEKKVKEKKNKEKKVKEKKPKKVKEKKEKKPKEKIPEPPLKPIGKKKILTGFLFGATVFGMILLCTSYIPDAMDKQESKKAFEKGDYQKVYDLLITKKLSEGKEKMLKGATLCLQIDRKLSSYENYKKLNGMELEQLDALISGVEKYHKIKKEAEQYGVAESLKNSYFSILNILQAEYGISEEQAKTLAGENDEVAYTKELMQILGMEIPTAENEDKR